MSDLREQFEKETGWDLKPPRGDPFAREKYFKELSDWLESRLASLTAEREEMEKEIRNLNLANEEARKTIDHLNSLIPHEANNGSRPLPEKGK